MGTRTIRSALVALTAATLAGCHGWYQVGYDMSGRQFNPTAEGIRRDGFAIPEAVYTFPFTSTGEAVTSDHTAFSQGHGSSATRHLYAVDIENGALRWDVDCAPVLSDASIAPVAYTAGQIVSGCTTGVLPDGTRSHAITAHDEFTGALLWHRDGIRIRGQHAGLLLAVGADNRTIEVLYANGTTAWTTILGQDAGIIRAEGATLWVEHPSTGVSALSILDGSLSFELPPLPGRLIAVSGGRLLIISGSATIRALDATTGAELWAHAVVCPDGSTPFYVSIATDGARIAFGATQLGETCSYGALDLASGALLWVTEPTHYAALMSVTIADGAAFFLARTDFVNFYPHFAVVRLTDGVILFSTDTAQGNSQAGGVAPVIANGLIFVRNGAYRFGDVIFPL